MNINLHFQEVDSTEQTIRITFTDFLDNVCIIQESKTGGNPKIRIGVLESSDGNVTNVRMSLDQETLKIILPYLINFANTNSLLGVDNCV